VASGIAYLKSQQHASAAGDSTFPIAASAGSQPTWTNSLGMKLVAIPAGTFQMGASAKEISSAIHGELPKGMMHETPQHTVTLTQPFSIGMHEVSVGQFRVFVEETGYQTTSERWLADHGRSPKQPVWNDPAHYSTADDLPVTGVSWEDAVQFCKWLSQREGVTYRLPTEAEWEYACRAGTTGPWCCEEEELGDYAVMSRLWSDGPCPIGQRLPNAWGLHDMHGNVWEWCQDYYSASFYETSPDTDPVCLELPADGDNHSLRSGGYFAGSRAIRSTMRRSHDASVAYADRGHAIGFRVACDAVSPRIAKRSP
jgi:formylglycine-generating enzyme required for sulfatase activity